MVNLDLCSLVRVLSAASTWPALLIIAKVNLPGKSRTIVFFDFSAHTATLPGFIFFL